MEPIIQVFSAKIQIPFEKPAFAKSEKNSGLERVK
jgi:hypothetical protein